MKVVKKEKDAVEGRNGRCTANVYTIGDEWAGHGGRGM